MDGLSSSHNKNRKWSICHRRTSWQNWFLHFIDLFQTDSWRREKEKKRTQKYMKFSDLNLSLDYNLIQVLLRNIAETTLNIYKGLVNLSTNHFFFYTKLRMWLRWCWLNRCTYLRSLRYRESHVADWLDSLCLRVQPADTDGCKCIVAPFAPSTRVLNFQSKIQDIVFIAGYWV